MYAFASWNVCSALLCSLSSTMQITCGFPASEHSNRVSNPGPSYGALPLDHRKSQGKRAQRKALVPSYRDVVRKHGHKARWNAQRIHDEDVAHEFVFSDHGYFWSRSIEKGRRRPCLSQSPINTILMLDCVEPSVCGNPSSALKPSLAKPKPCPRSRPVPGFSPMRRGGLDRSCAASASVSPIGRASSAMVCQSSTCL